MWEMMDPIAEYIVNDYWHYLEYTNIPSKSGRSLDVKFKSCSKEEFIIVVLKYKFMGNKKTQGKSIPMFLNI